jgi:hypothetical protein
LSLGYGGRMCACCSSATHEQEVAARDPPHIVLLVQGSNSSRVNGLYVIDDDHHRRTRQWKQSYARGPALLTDVKGRQKKGATAKGASGAGTEEGGHYSFTKRGVPVDKRRRLWRPRSRDEVPQNVLDDGFSAWIQFNLRRHLWEILSYPGKGLDALPRGGLAEYVAEEGQVCKQQPPTKFWMLGCTGFVQERQGWAGGDGGAPPPKLRWLCKVGSGVEKATETGGPIELGSWPTIVEVSNRDRV